MYVMHNTLHKYSDRKADVNSSNFSITAKHMNTINFKSTRLQCKLNFCNQVVLSVIKKRNVHFTWTSLASVKNDEHKLHETHFYYYRFFVCALLSSNFHRLFKITFTKLEQRTSAQHKNWSHKNEHFS